MKYTADGNISAAKEITAQAIKMKTDNLPAAPAAQARLDSSLYTSRLAKVDVDAAMAAGPLVVSVDIQPPVGETWVVYVNAGVKSSVVEAVAVGIYYYNGVTGHGGTTQHNAGTFSIDQLTPNVGVEAVLRITNTMYCRIYFYHASADINTRRGHSYWGFKE